MNFFLSLFFIYLFFNCPFSPFRSLDTLCTGWVIKDAIIGWELYFKNKKNLEQIMSISKLVMNLPLQWWKNGEDWLRRSRDMLILIEWHKNTSVQLWHASSNMQIHKSTVYEGSSVSLQPKVEADVLYNCNLARVQIYSIDEYTESLKL